MPDSGRGESTTEMDENEQGNREREEKNKSCDKKGNLKRQKNRYEGRMGQLNKAGRQERTKRKRGRRVNQKRMLILENFN